jgi:hypothetical protein
VSTVSGQSIHDVSRTVSVRVPPWASNPLSKAPCVKLQQAQAPANHAGQRIGGSTARQGASAAASSLLQARDLLHSTGDAVLRESLTAIAAQGNVDTCAAAALLG